MSININGSSVSLPTDPRISLLDLLRDHLELAGTKKGCIRGRVEPARYWLTVNAFLPVLHWRYSIKVAR